MSLYALEGAEISAWMEVSQHLPSALFVPGKVEGALHGEMVYKEKEGSKKLRLISEVNFVGTSVLSILPSQ